MFTISEWPSFQQRSYAELSIGEEISESHVISCSWSAPGLAKHDRCMLGVLTANGLYSLWDAKGDLSFTTSWHRVQVLNIVLESFFASKNVETSTVPVRRYRIRAAVWAKRLKLCDQLKSFQDNFVLALLNDQGEIIFLTIENAEDKQLSQPLCRVIDVLDLHSEINSYPDGLLDELQWLDWDTLSDSANAVLFCSSKGRTWKIHTQIKSPSTGSMDMTCSFSTPIPRESTNWNTAEEQMSTLRNPYLNIQQKQLKRSWERGQGEGYPGFTRYYGVAAYKDFQASHMSFHPRTVIEYHIQAQEISYVLFSHSSLKAPGASATKIKFDWEISATVMADNNSSAGPWRMILSELSGLQFEELSQDDQWTTGSRTIRSWLTMAVLRGWNLTETLDLLRKLSDQSVDQEILDMIDEYREESSNIEALQQIEGIVDSFFKTPESLETCSICGERLKWHNERAARCQQGHVFGKHHLSLIVHIY